MKSLFLFFLLFPTFAWAVSDGQVFAEHGGNVYMTKNCEHLATDYPVAPPELPDEYCYTDTVIFSGWNGGSGVFGFFPATDGTFSPDDALCHYVDSDICELQRITEVSTQQNDVNVDGSKTASFVVGAIGAFSLVCASLIRW